MVRGVYNNYFRDERLHQTICSKSTAACIFNRTSGLIITTNCPHVKLNAWRNCLEVIMAVCCCSKDKKCFSVPLFMELHAESCPGPVGNRRGWEVMPWWLIMWPSSFSPPPPGERLEITLRAMFLDCPLFHFLYLKMFSAPVQTHSYSSAAVFPQSPSSFFHPQSSSSASSVPTAGPLCPLHKIPLVSLRRAFRSGTQNLLDKKREEEEERGKNTAPPCWTHSQRLCMMRCVRLSALCSPCSPLFSVTFFEAASESLISLLSSWLQAVSVPYSYAGNEHTENVITGLFPFSTLHPFITMALVQLLIRPKAFRKADNTTVSPPNKKKRVPA